MEMWANFFKALFYKKGKSLWKPRAVGLGLNIEIEETDSNSGQTNSMTGAACLHPDKIEGILKNKIDLGGIKDEDYEGFDYKSHRSTNRNRGRISETPSNDTMQPESHHQETDAGTPFDSVHSPLKISSSSKAQHES
jgi:hypothetical protein